MPAMILLVEDDPGLLDLMTYIFKDAGYQVVRAFGGEDALRKLEREEISLVVTDLAMPHMSGVELISRIKMNSETADIPVLAVSAHVSMGQSASRADGFIGKPFDRDRLLKEVERLLKPKAG